MSLCPSTVASSGQPLDLYFPLVENLPSAQVLSQAGNTVSLSGGGGSVNVASTTSVASSAQKTTAITYNTGLLETNVAGVLNVGLGSAIGSTRVEGGNVVISRTDANPALEFTSGANTASIDYNPTGSTFGEPSLISDAHEIGISTGPTAGVSIGYNTAISTSYVSGKGDPLFIGEAGANSFSGLLLGNGNVGVTDFLILDRKDNTNVANTAASISMTGVGQLNIESSLATGGIGISTTAAANITIASAQGVGVTAATDIVVDATGDFTVSVGNPAGRINLNGGAALITAVPPVGIGGNYLLLTINSATYKIALLT
jgi:hypothetical protein